MLINFDVVLCPNEVISNNDKINMNSKPITFFIPTHISALHQKKELF